MFAFRAEDRYVSSGVVRFTLAGHADGDRQLALDRFRQMEQEILSRKSLTEIITQPALDLYDEDRKTTPLGEVVDNMRRVLSIKPAQLPSGRIATFVISCEYPDKFKAQSVVRELVVKFIERTSRHRGVSRHPLRRFSKFRIQPACPNALSGPIAR